MRIRTRPASASLPASRAVRNATISFDSPSCRAATCGSANKSSTRVWLLFLPALTNVSASFSDLSTALLLPPVSHVSGSTAI